jgi:energy-coupling factor transport system substrate-specific component
MSWELTSFLILGGVLLAGFVWYERSRPPSQIVALVGALAALAIAGRIAFAAFPNVKPTTDIVIFAGYALGGAPGFAVGAFTALVSNFWFGQGPWTPWQMAAWGLCGVFGALLALGARNAGRLTLAAACGFAGIVFGALMNFSLMATYGGDLSWRHFWLLEGKGVPFDAAHATGNVVFALVAGPAMVRMLRRFRERFEWSRGSGPQPGAGAPGRLGGALRGGGVAALLLVLALGLFAPASAHASAVSKGADWLESVQRPSGGFAADASGEAGAEMTGWAMLALAAAGRNPLDVTKNGKSPVQFLATHLGEVKDAGDLARTILALEATGSDPRSFQGEDLVQRLFSQRRDSGSYQGWPATSAYAVLALRAAGANDAAAKTVEWLRKVQGKDGGWGNEPKDPSTAEVTGAVLQVLSTGSDASDRALAYLRKAKRPNGGYAPGNNLSANAQATAWASQGLLAAGKDPAGFGPGGSSLAYLRNLQADDGRFLQAPDQEASPVWVTADVLVPLSGDFLPVSAPPRKPKPKAKKQKSGSSEPSGGSTSPSAPPSQEEIEKAFEKFPGGSGSGGGGAGGSGSGPSGGTPSGGGGSGAPSTGGFPGAGGGAGSVPPGTAPATGLPSTSSATKGDASGEPASETTDSGSSTAGSIVLGLLAGCVLFLLGFAARRGWMRWRYGL